MVQTIAQLLRGELPAIFLILQFVVFAAFFYLFLTRKNSSLSSDSSFALRESDRVDALRKLHQQRLNKPSSDQAKGPATSREESARAKVLQLPGIRIDGMPHEILGVSPTASFDEVKRAYRDLMKQYHPDKVAPPGTRAWNDAQKIAEAINSAKEQMLSRRNRA